MMRNAKGQLTLGWCSRLLNGKVDVTIRAIGVDALVLFIHMLELGFIVVLPSAFRAICF